MAVRSLRVLTTFVTGRDARRPGAARREPVRLVLAPEAGVTPSDLPPVRIFVGSESAQFRAERVFVWSVKRSRDPAREYHIYLMRDFAGFERRLWLTGFTNYRFVIPELAGGLGRAIYNDADQIYLRDPAALFDTPMDEHGVLSINDHDTSVMLIDCAKMADQWNWRTAQQTRNRELEARMRESNLWGHLDGAWNARDAEYVAGESALVHYTTIHTQPWRPFPQDYVYQANSASEIWLNLEREADAAGFQLFDAQGPSPQFEAASQTNGSGRVWPARLADYQTLAADAQARSLYYCGYMGQQVQDRLQDETLRAEDVELSTPAQEPQGDVGIARAEMVIAEDLEALPDLDIPWLLDRLFARASRAIIISVDLGASVLPHCPADAFWWHAQVVAAAARNPQRHWRLLVRKKVLAGGLKTRRWSGGTLLRNPPRVWALLHYKTGHASQVQGLADALGWPYTQYQMQRRPWRYLAATLRARMPFTQAQLPGEIQAPWPDLIIASGWMPALVARWISRRNGGNTRLILMGRRGSRVGESQHIGIHCEHFQLPPHPRQFETLLPPSKVNAQRLQEAAALWPDLYADASRPRVALLVGGDNAQCEMPAQVASSIMQRVREYTQAMDGSLAVLVSRRTPAEAAAALQAGAGSHTIFEPLRSKTGDRNPYMGYLAKADILVVTGESESMLAEAAATGKPVYIAPLPQSAPKLRQRLANWVYRQAVTDRFNARGSRRPQEGLQYLCARLVEHRLLMPRRDLRALHEALVHRGLARYLDSNALESWQPSKYDEVQTLAQRIRAELQAEEGAATSAAHARRRAANA